MNIETDLPFEEELVLDIEKKKHILEFYQTNSRQQMKRTQYFVESGIYTEWLTSLTDEQLETFIQKNKQRIQYMKMVNTPCQIQANKYLWRNTFYRLELLRRQHGGDFPSLFIEDWLSPDENRHGFSIQTMSTEE